MVAYVTSAYLMHNTILVMYKFNSFSDSNSFTGGLVGGIVGTVVGTLIQVTVYVLVYFVVKRYYLDGKQAKGTYVGNLLDYDIRIYSNCVTTVYNIYYWSIHMYLANTHIPNTIINSKSDNDYV